MSTDFKEEVRPVVETREPMTEEEIIKILVDEFNAMFTRANLEKDPSLIMKMNKNLEVPVTTIYKDRKISNICTNLALIREALSAASNIKYDQEKEIITPKLKSLKNKILLNKIPDSEKDKIFKIVYQSPEYFQKVSDKYMDYLKSYMIILRTEESANSLLEKIKASVNSESTIEITHEYEDLYLDLLQKAQDAMKSNSFGMRQPGNFPFDPYYQNYGYYYGSNSYMNPYMGQSGGSYYGPRGANYDNQYYNGYYDNMFIRKAQEETYEEESQRGDYHGRYARKKDRYTKKPYFPKSQQRSDTKANHSHMSPEEIKRRTRVNSENFPPLLSDEKPRAEGKNEEQEAAVVEPKQEEKKEKEVDKSGKILRHHKDEMLKIFKVMGSELKPSESLKKFTEKQIPILNLDAKPSLEFIQSSPKKN